MKKKFSIIYIAALCFLTGCGEEVGRVSYSTDDTAAVMATAPIETTAPAATAPPVKSEKPETAILTVDDSIEVYEELTLSELLTYTNVQLNNGDEIIDTSETGTFDTTVSYTYMDELYEHTLSYSVSDTTAPTILNSGGSAYVEAGKPFDLGECVGFADNYDPTPALTYEGYVDTSVCGTYPVSASVTDSSGNTTSWDVNIQVVNEIPVPEDNNARLSFDSFTQQYAGENVRFGIDVSKWQGDIDFEAVKNAGCSFVIMRIGSYYDEAALDSYYTANMAAAKAAGLDVGVYIYTTANTEDEVKANAQWIAELLGGQELDFPVVFDWESFSNFQQYEMSIHDLNSLFVLFADEMEQYGYSSMLYSSKNFLNNFWYEHSEYPIWLAHYTDQTDYTGEYAMWQMSCYGRIDGIAGDVDLNILYTDKPMN
ncbi:MAG: glycoside hydrolase family 25 [Ruminococcus sp.]|nr:glycoside hydrolase family 25 [Ruminococcus sp.]